MTTFQFIVLILTGLVAGTLSGSLGIGGGIVMAPALIFILGFTQHQAQGTTLAVMLLPVVLPGAYQYYKAGHINIKFALLIMVSFMVGSYFGGIMANKIPANTLQKFFAVLLILVGIKMLFSK